MLPPSFGRVDRCCGALMRIAVRGRGLFDRWGRMFTVGLWDSEEAVAEWLGFEAQAKVTPFATGDFEVQISGMRLDEAALRGEG